MTAAREIAAAASRLEFADLPAEAVERAKLHVLDVLGCGLAAAGLDEGTAAVRWVAGQAGEGRAATVLGSGMSAAPADAALANGMLCHALDFDDTHPDSRMHLSAVVVPAALAVAQDRGSDGRQLATAIVAGLETSARIGMAATGAFHARGLHPTSVCGVFGATVAAGMLTGLSEQEMVSALGLAGSTAAGLFEYLADGTETKPFHAGWAAHAGVVAAGLASLGATGPATVLEGRYGLFRAFLGDEVEHDVMSQVADLGERWETLSIAFKPYPTCHFTHAAIEAAALLRASGLDPDEIESVMLEVPADAVGIVLEPLAHKRRPATAYDAKFSLPFTTAVMLRDGGVDNSSFVSSRLTDPLLLGLCARTEYTVVDPAGRGQFFTLVRAVRSDGSVETADVSHPLGTAESPLGADVVLAKFLSNVESLLSASDARAASEAILAIEALDDVGALALVPTAVAGEGR